MRALGILKLLLHEVSLYFLYCFVIIPTLVSISLTSFLSPCLGGTPKGVFLTNEAQLMCVFLSSTGLPGKQRPGKLPGGCRRTSSEAWWLWRSLHCPGGEDHSKKWTLVLALTSCLYISSHSTRILRITLLSDITWGLFLRENIQKNNNTHFINIFLAS